MYYIIIYTKRPLSAIKFRHMLKQNVNTLYLYTSFLCALSVLLFVLMAKLRGPHFIAYIVQKMYVFIYAHTRTHMHAHMRTQVGIVNLRRP